MIQEMTMTQLKDIYQKHMIDDFPDDERKPYQIIATRLKKKQNICICYFEENVMKGYSILEYSDVNQCLLMDYFAIFPEFRNQGAGSRFIQEMKEYFSDWNALLIESETAVDQIAERRLRFYQKSGAQISGTQVHLYHVDYEILTLPIKRKIHDEDVQGLLDEIYQKIYPAPFHKIFIRWI